MVPGRKNRKQDKMLASNCRPHGYKRPQCGRFSGERLGSNPEKKRALGVKSAGSRRSKRLSQESNQRKEPKLAQKQKIPVYLQPENMKRLEEHFKDDGSTTRTEFVEKAVNFYIGYLQAERDATYLP